jgi:hypothetical protein
MKHAAVQCRPCSTDARTERRLATSTAQDARAPTCRTRSSSASVAKVVNLRTPQRHSTTASSQARAPLKEQRHQAGGNWQLVHCIIGMQHRREAPVGHTQSLCCVRFCACASTQPKVTAETGARML